MVRDHSEMSGIRKGLKASELMSVCEGMGASQGDFKKAMIMESVVYPLIRKSDSEAQKNAKV